VRELTLRSEVVRYRRERWITPAGETVLAPLPAGIVGGLAWQRMVASMAKANLTQETWRCQPCYERSKAVPSTIVVEAEFVLGCLEGILGGPALPLGGDSRLDCGPRGDHVVK
jgi:hypothetical protein